MKPLIHTLIIGALAGSFSLAHAADESGAYLGASFGSASTDQSNFDSAASYKAFIGAQANNFGLELGYVDLGKFDQSNGSGSVSVKGGQLNALGELFINHGINGYASFGMYSYQMDNSAGSNSSGTSLTYGLGLKIMMGKQLAIRGGWERFQDVSDSRIDLISLGALIKF